MGVSWIKITDLILIAIQSYIWTVSQYYLV